MPAFVVLGLVFSVPRQEIDLGKRLRHDLFCVEWDVKRTRISIQITGLAFGGTGLCFYRVRGVDGSCAKHLTAESSTVICAANSHTCFVFRHPLSLSFQT